MRSEKSTTIFGLFLGAAIAVVIAAGAGPLAAGDKGGAGMPCKSNGDCESFICSANKCKGKDGSTKGGAGAPCKSNGECESFICSANKCKGKDGSTKGAAGAPCKSNGECESFICSANKCKGK